jgi:hypothetical protein
MTNWAALFFTIIKTTLGIKEMLQKTHTFHSFQSSHETNNNMDERPQCKSIFTSKRHYMTTSKWPHPSFLVRLRASLVEPLLNMFFLSDVQL